MGLFNKKPKKGPDSIVDSDNICGYLFTLINDRISLNVRIKKKNWNCGLYEIDLKKKVIRIQDHGFDMYEHDEVIAGFSLDKTWFEFRSNIILIKNKPYLLLPELIYRNDRRKHQRSSFSSREDVNVSVLQDMGSGIGVTGKALNLTQKGMLMSIDRAILLSKEKQITIMPDLYKKGTDLFMIKLKNLPRCNDLDLSGSVIEIRRSGRACNLAIEFKKTSSQVENNLAGVVASRIIPYKPITRSYKKIFEMKEKRIAEREKENQKAKSSEVQQNIQTEETAKETVQATNSQSVQSPAEAIQKNVLIIGNELYDNLTFLSGFKKTGIDKIPLVIDYLSKIDPEYILSYPTCNNVDILELLIKLSTKNFIDQTAIVLFLKENISKEEIIKIKNAKEKIQIKNIIKMPIVNKQVLAETLT